MVALTIGMATYDDFDGVYFTLQALRLYQDVADTEFLVIDNYGCETTKNFVQGWVKARYILATDVVGTAASRDMLFREGNGEAILCVDSHVLLAPGAIARLKQYYQDHPDTIDLLQGPLLYDDGTSISTHFEPVWREQMWGTWATDPRGLDPEGEPFEIPMQGLGIFSCRKRAWPGFNPAFRGFGGEEGYIHQKIRRAGGRCLCLPWLRWMHRFGRPKGVAYPLTVEDKFRNYLIGHDELGLDLTPVLEHFAQYLPQSTIEAITASVIANRPTVPGFTPVQPAPPAERHATVVPEYSPFFDPSQQLVSCVCPTYNRPPEHQYLVEEAVESFLRQTYPNKELILLNDCPGQEIVCEAPGVRVVNLPERLPSLGEKLNVAIKIAAGDLIAIWDDDDVSLPWRLALSVERLEEGDYFNPRAYWFLDRGTYHHDHAVGYAVNASLFRRRAFEDVGCFPPISLGADAWLDSTLGSLPNVVDPRRGATPLTRAEWFYVYRWGVSPVHVSGNANPDFYQEIGKRPIQPGRFVLRPHWRRDYETETRALLDI